jgi:hypothetical protein
MPGLAQAHPDLSVSAAPLDDVISVTGRAGANSLHHRLEVGTADVTEGAGPLRFGLTMQYGTVIRSDTDAYWTQQSDQRSLRSRRELFAGGVASLGLAARWRLRTSWGRVQLRMHDSLGDNARRRTLNEDTLGGWRMTAGLQHPFGAGWMTMGWQMTRYAGAHGSDPGRPTRGSHGHMGLELTAPL